MRIVIAAPCGTSGGAGEALLAAARERHDASLFDHPASRDPTLELPDLVSRTRPDVVLLIDVAREDPETLDTLRELGARVAVWVDATTDGAAPWVLARRRWIAGGADATATTRKDEAHVLLDRMGREALLLNRPDDGAELADRIETLLTWTTSCATDVAEEE